VNKWLVVFLIFSLAVNLAVVGTLLYFTRHPSPPVMMPEGPMGRPGIRENGEPRPDGPGADLPGRMPPEVEKLRESFIAGLRPLSRDLQQSRQQLVRMMDRQPAAADSIAIVLQKINTLQGEMEKLTVDHLMAIRPYLEKSQWQNLTRILQQRVPEPLRMDPKEPRPGPAPLDPRLNKAPEFVPPRIPPEAQR